MGLPEAQRTNPVKSEFKDQYPSKPTRDNLQKLAYKTHNFRHFPYELKRSSSALGREHYNKNCHYQVSPQLGNYGNVLRNPYNCFIDKQENKNDVHVLSNISPKNTNNLKPTKHEDRSEIGKVCISYRHKTPTFREIKLTSNKKSDENLCRGKKLNVDDRLHNRYDSTKALRDSSYLHKPISTYTNKPYNSPCLKTQEYVTAYYGSFQRSYKDSLLKELRDDTVGAKHNHHATSNRKYPYIQKKPRQEDYESLKPKGTLVKPVAPHCIEDARVYSKMLKNKVINGASTERAQTDKGNEGARSFNSSTSCSSEEYHSTSSETLSTNLSNNIQALICRCIRSIENVGMTEENCNQIKELKNLLQGNNIYQCYYTHGDQVKSAFNRVLNDSAGKIRELISTNNLRKSVSLDNSLKPSFLKNNCRLSKQRRENFLGKISHIIQEIKSRRLESKKNKTETDSYFNALKNKIHNTHSQTKHGNGGSVSEINSKTVHFKASPRLHRIKYTSSLKTAAMAVLKQDRTDFGKMKSVSKRESIPSILRVKFKQQAAGADYTQNTTQTDSTKNNQINCVTVDCQFKSCSFPEKRTCETTTEDIAIINEETQMSGTEIVSSHEKVSFATNTEMFRATETDKAQVCTILRSDTCYKDSQDEESKIPFGTSEADNWETESDTSNSHCSDEPNETNPEKKTKGNQKRFICGWIKKIQSFYRD